MTLSSGTRLGPYEVVAPLGAGGMGEVYRARDGRLGRDVAVKVLPPSVAGDAERLRRFEQEARATSALNHPNILAIHDLGTHDGGPYVVSELLEGEALRERIGGSPLPLRKAIDYGMQIARGLAAAHEKGVVHRDLKPDNLFVTRDGRVKILDFGLAKLTGEFVSESETRTSGGAPGTDAGRVLGTLGYMSPEQVRAQPADHRSDIFAFGAVLYEMITGHRAFRGASAVETMNAILKEDPPPLSETNRTLPPALERIVSHCLEKSPDERFQSARDIAFDLEALSGSSAAVAAVPARAARRWLRPALLAAGIAAALALAIFAGRQTAPRSQATHEPLTFRRGIVRAATFAPDGRTVVYDARWETRPPEIFSTQPGSPESRSLGIVDAALAGVSSQGELAVLLDKGTGAGRTLARVPLGGGAPRDVLEGVLWADWSPDGSTFAITRLGEGRQQIEYPVGKVLYRSDSGISWLRVSPRGDRVAFCEHPIRGDSRGDVVTVDSAGTRTVLSAGWEDVGGLAWRPDGQEIWFTATKAGSDRALHAVSLAFRERLVERVPGHLELQDISESGEVLLSHGTRRPVIMGRGPGMAQEVDLSWLDYPESADVSRDGRTVLFSEEGIGGGAGYSVYLRALDGSPAVRLGKGYARALSPEGKWALTISLGATPRLVLLPTGAGEARTLPNGGLTGYHWAGFLPDGKSVLITGNESGRGVRLYLQDLGGGDPRAVTPEGVFTDTNTISPAGDAVVAETIDGPRIFPLGGGEARTIRGIERREVALRWSADGRSLYVMPTRPGPARISRLDLATGRREPWRELAPADMTGVGRITTVQMTPDGSAYVYTYIRALSNLYLVRGLR